MEELTDATPRIGSVLDGKYEILTRIASGGFGSVYRARHLAMAKEVAIKVLHPRFSVDPEVVKRFQHEARTIATLRHPNILTVYAFGTADDLVYMVTELVEGKSLGNIIRAVGPLPPEQAMPLFLQVCDAMTHAHKNDVLHRDLKPDNIVIVTEPDNTKSVKVIDFGLAKLLHGEQRMTKTGEVVGDPNYMSPEQAQGQQLDARSDVYSFGCSMYEVLTGNKPFRGDDPVAVLFQQVSQPPEPFAQRLHLPKALEVITLTAMAKNTDVRFDSFEAVKSALEKFVANPEVSMKIPAGANALSGGARIGGSANIRIKTLALLVLVAAMLGGMGWWIYSERQQRQLDTKRALEQEELRGFMREAVDWYPDKPRWNIKTLERYERIAREEGNSIALASVKQEQFNTYKKEGNLQRATEAATDGLRVAGIKPLQRNRLLKSLGDINIQARLLNSAEHAYEQLVEDEQSAIYDVHDKMNDDEHVLTLAWIKNKLKKPHQVEELCERIYPKFRIRVNDDDDRIKEHFKLIDMYLAVDRLDRAEELMSFVDCPSLLRKGKVHPIVLCKLKLYSKQRKFDDVDSLRKQLDALDLSAKTRVDYLSVIAGNTSLRTDPERAARLYKELKTAKAARDSAKAQAARNSEEPQPSTP